MQYRAAIAQLDALNGPDWPESLDYLRGWFFELHHTRGYDMNGAQPLTYPMIESWAMLTDRQPDPQEVAALMRLDLAFRFPGDPGDAAKAAR